MDPAKYRAAAKAISAVPIEVHQAVVHEREKPGCSGFEVSDAHQCIQAVEAELKRLPRADLLALARLVVRQKLPAIDARLRELYAQFVARFVKERLGATSRISGTVPEPRARGFSYTKLNS